MVRSGGRWPAGAGGGRCSGCGSRSEEVAEGLAIYPGVRERQAGAVALGYGLGARAGQVRGAGGVMVASAEKRA